VDETSDVVVRSWAEGPLPCDVQSAIERLARSDDVRRIAVMPDVHLSADVCVGTVVATTRTLYPNAVGGDIGCGIAALAFDGEATLLHDEHTAAEVLAGLYRAIPLVRHRRKSVGHLPLALDTRPLSAPPSRPSRDAMAPSRSVPSAAATTSWSSKPTTRGGSG